MSCLNVPGWGQRKEGWVLLECTVPENIHTPPTEGIGISWGVGGGGSIRPKNLKKCMKLNWNFLRGGGGYRYFLELHNGCVPFSKSGFGLQNRDFRDSVYKMKHEIRSTIPASSLVLLPRL